MIGFPLTQDEHWIENLVRQIKDRRLRYEDELSLEGRRHQAALMVGDLTIALSNLPSLADVDLHPLKHILMMFNDLENGRAHPWSVATNFGGTNRYTSAMMEVRVWVTMAQDVLVRAGHSGKAADKIVRAHLAATGREYSLPALEKWRKEFKTGHDPRLRHVKQLLAQHWHPTRCHHGSDPLQCVTAGQRPCSDGKCLAEAFAEWAIKTPLFQDRIPSPYRK